MFFFIDIRRRRYEQHLVNLRLKLFKVQRTVILCRRQAKAIVHQRGLSGLVAGIHPSDLRYGNMRFIYYNEKIVLKIFHQRQRRRARRKPCKIPGIIFNPAAKPGFPQHLNIKIGAFRNPLRLQQLIFSLKITDTFFQLLFNIHTCPVNLLLRNYIMRSRKNTDMLQRCLNLPRQHVNLRNSIDLISKKLHPNRALRTARRKNLQHIPAHPKRPPVKIHLISRILNINQVTDHIIAVTDHPRTQRNHHPQKILRTAQSINTRHTRNHNHIPALRQRRRRRQAQLVDFFVDGRVLCNVCV